MVNNLIITYKFKTFNINLQNIREFADLESELTNKSLYIKKSNQICQAHSIQYIVCQNHLKT